MNSVEELEALQAQAEVVKGAVQMAFFVPFVIQFVMSAAMSHVWNIFNLLRLVNTLPMYDGMDSSLPINVRTILSAFVDITNLKLVDTDAIYDQV